MRIQQQSGKKLPQDMTNEQLLHYGIQMLRDCGILEAETDAWLLFAYVTGFSRAEYYLHSREVSMPEWRESYLDKITVRGGHIPLQQITGEQEFMGLPFSVNEYVLIPRSDTEVLVETVLPMAEGKRVLDMCTGSGCIIISIAVLGLPESCVGVDVSGEALKVAQHNDRKLDGGVSFVESDLFEQVTGTYDLIVSNPPYIPPDVLQGLMEEVREHEPRIALDGGRDGLRFYRDIVDESRKYLAADGVLAFEIGHDQRSAVVKYMRDAGFSDIQCRKDYAGHDRIVYGKYKQSQG